MTSFIKLRPFVTNDLLLCHKMLDIVPREDSLASSPLEKSHQVVDTEKELVVSLDLPGVKASDLSVTTRGETIQISGARRFVLGGAPLGRRELGRIEGHGKCFR